MRVLATLASVADWCREKGKTQAPSGILGDQSVFLCKKLGASNGSYKITQFSYASQFVTLVYLST